ncbi:UNVERIFIED_CONTAM: hypothetical protein GTU68_000071 [Idotea baltica]|nr:hypothetical protein [Idotea baltica]
MPRRFSLLLLSNSKNYGARFLDHALGPIEELVQHDELVFVPFALADHKTYGDLISKALSTLPITVRVATPDQDGAKLISEASVLFVGGGNTFRLLKTVQALDVMPSIRERYEQGDLRYMGSSAGTNLACPTIKTTNDMPIVVPDGFEALGLVPFQINAHFQDDEAFEGHMGETRRTRLTEYLEENDVPVIALREGAWIKGLGNGELTVGGNNGAIVFCRSDVGTEERELVTGDTLSESTPL